MLVPCRTTSYLKTLPNCTQSLYIAELYPIAIHCCTIPYLKPLTNFTLSWYNAGIYLNLIHCRTVLYLNTLPNYTLYYYNAKLHPILRHCRTTPYLGTLLSPKISRLPNKIEHQNHRQPIRIAYYLTRELSAMVEDLLGSHFTRRWIVYPNT